jgi:trimethylamine--corrinoid protein Co-methyltransferase
MQMAARHLVLYGQNPAHDAQIGAQNVHFATAGAAVMIADSENNRYRESTTQDLYDMARIVDTCEHIHIFHRTCVLRDIADNCEMDQNTLYCSLVGTSKHVGSAWTEVSHLEKSLRMLHLVAGGEAQWRARPFVSQANCFVVPPMKFAGEALKCLRLAVEAGMPVILLSAGQAGATTPACLAGAVSQAWAECLGGLVYANAIKPGAPAILGAWPFVSDLRTGAMSGGSPEQGLLSSACAQIGETFDLPFSTACGMTDAKLPDFQAGAERASTALAAALSGANIVYESAGMYASLLGTCPESFLLDNDVLGAAMRMTRSIEVTEESLSFETIREVCMGGEGHYLSSPQTLSVMQSEYLYPQFSDRDSPLAWQDNGKPVLLERAIARKKEILEKYFPTHINDDIDRQIRSEFQIHLSREQIGRL